MRPLLCHLSYAAASGDRARNLQSYRTGVKRTLSLSEAIVPARGARRPGGFAGLTIWSRSNTGLLSCRRGRRVSASIKPILLDGMRMLSEGAEFGIEHISQGVAEQVEREHRQTDR